MYIFAHHLIVVAIALRESRSVSCFVYVSVCFDLSYSIIGFWTLAKAFKYIQTNKQTPWPESANKLYRPSDHRLSAKPVPTFADRGVSRGQRGVSPTAIISVF
jgi:hypothetical protein